MATSQLPELVELETIAASALSSFEEVKLLILKHLAALEVKDGHHDHSCNNNQHPIAIIPQETQYSSNTKLIEIELERDLVSTENKALKSKLESFVYQQKDTEAALNAAKQSNKIQQAEICKLKEDVKQLERDLSKESRNNKQTVNEIELLRSVVKKFNEVRDFRTEKDYILRSEYDFLNQSFKNLQRNYEGLMIELTASKKSTSSYAHEASQAKMELMEMRKRNYVNSCEESKTKSTNISLQSTVDGLRCSLENEKRRSSALIIELKTAENSLNLMEKSLKDQARIIKMSEKRLDD